MVAERLGDRLEPPRLLAAIGVAVDRTLVVSGPLVDPDLASEAAGTARDTASSFEKLLRNTIETQPYTTAFVALGIGWLLGRMHRPL
jgi:hypothetical protein